MSSIHPWDFDKLIGWGQDEERAAGAASAVDVDPVVCLLFPDELEGFMLALEQSKTDHAGPIYAFVGGGATTCR